jgi:hypothetical protein
LGIVLSATALLLLTWTFYRSRGLYRLANQTLYAPGHPPVPLDRIQLIDKTLWDRKGIAYVEYQTPAGHTRRLKLDDFLHQPGPTRQICARIEAYLVAPEGVAHEPKQRGTVA